MRVLAVTLARGNTNEVPNKNMYNINGRPLLYYTIKEVKKSKYIKDYFISSDSDEILKYAELQGCNTVNRPKELALNSATNAEALIHALDKANESGRRKYGEQEPYDIVVEIMTINPLKTVEDIDGVIEKIVKTDSDSVVAVSPVHDFHPSRLKYIQDDLLKDFFPEPSESRKEDLTPTAYSRNGSIYAVKTNVLRKYKTRFGPETRPYVMTEDHTINVDRLMNMKLAELMIKKRDYLEDMGDLSSNNIYL